MDLLDLGKNLLKEQFGGGGDSSQLTSALGGLFKSESNDFDMGSVVSKMMGNSSLAGLASSWLGDGDNDKADSNQMAEIFGGNKIEEFASKLGIDKGAAEKGLANVIPQMIDKSSSGGSLLDSVGGLSGAADLLKKLF
jgi:uncharacterized protein YidB (DUF937 family)